MNTTKAVAVFSLFMMISQTAYSGTTSQYEYRVKSFPLLGDETTSQKLNKFVHDNDLEVVNCSVYEAQLVCVLKKEK